MNVKVCGMRDPQNITQLSRLPIDYMGFIFWEKSKRFVDQPTPELSQQITKVGVFVDASKSYILQMAQTHQLKALQLHGNESPQVCAQLKAKGFVIVKAFAVGKSFDFNRLQAFEPHCDFFLFDTKSDLPGGSGQQFDWTLLNAYNSTTPFWISGGIGPGDVAAIQELKKKKLPLHSIDLNSKFETAPAQKDIALLEEFLKQLT